MNQKEFRNPSALYRTSPFWSWNDKLDKDELTRQMDEMIDKGWGSSFMHSRVGLVTGYLSEEWMELTRVCAEHARKTGTHVWLYDEDKWPSGFAGGVVPEKNEKYRSRALVLLTKEQITENDTVLKEIEYEGVQYFICKNVAPLGNARFNGASYVDLMNPEMVQEFLKCTHDAYKKACGDSFGNGIPGVFTDEPCYLMHNQYAMPVVPWSDFLPEFFTTRKGYDLLPHLDKLFFDIGDYRKIRFDFYDAATRLFIESFTKPYYKWCEENNLLFTGHFMAEGNLMSQTIWIGAAMPHYEFMHWPGIDKLGRNINQHVTVKQLTSVADQLGRERTLCEVFGCIGQQSSFFERKWITDWQAVLGINFVNSHLSLYSMRGERKRDYPPNLFTQQPWWEDERQFSDYTGRISYAITQGKRCVDILVLHPVASVWSEYSPLHGGIETGETRSTYDYIHEKVNYDIPFDRLAWLLMANKLDYHLGDEMIMENHARIEGDKLVVGEYSYSTVVVPPMLTIRESTLDLLKQFAKKAGSQQIVFIKQIPSRVNGRETDLGLYEGTFKVKTVEEAIRHLDTRYRERVQVTDLATGLNAEYVICHERCTENGKLLLVANTDEKREVQVRLSIPSKNAPVLLDMVSGNEYAIPFLKNEGTIEIVCTLHPAGSLLLSFPEQSAKIESAPTYIRSGVEFEKGYRYIGSIEKWKASLLEENVLPIHELTLTVDGKKVLQDKHVAYAWHDIFYQLEDGTPFEAEYTFEVQDIPDHGLTAVIELAENLDGVFINEKRVMPLKACDEGGAFDPEKSWKDVHFTRVPLGNNVVEGLNTIRLAGKKVNNTTGPGNHKAIADFNNHKPTEVETIYLIGDFKLTGDSRTGYMIQKSTPISFGLDITKEGYPFYAGQALYEENVCFDGDEKPVYLKIEDVDAASIRLAVNGQNVDVGYSKPYLFDISQVLNKGNNHIQITASTTLFNLMGPNWIEGVLDYPILRPKHFFEFERFTKDYTLLRFGIGKGLLMTTK